MFYFVFRVDHVLGTVAGVLTVMWPTFGTRLRAAGSLLPLLACHVLSHCLRSFLQFVDCAAYRLDIFGVDHLADLRNSRLDWCTVSSRQVRVCLKLLFHLVRQLVCLVAGVDQLAFAPVLCGPRLGFFAHS